MSFFHASAMMTRAKSKQIEEKIKIITNQNEKYKK